MAIPTSVLPTNVYRVREAKGVIMAQPGNRSFALRSTTQISSLSLTYRLNKDLWCLAASNLQRHPSRESLSDRQLLSTRTCFDCAKNNELMLREVSDSVFRNGRIEPSLEVARLSVLLWLRVRGDAAQVNKLLSTSSSVFVELSQSAFIPAIDLKLSAVVREAKLRRVSSSGK